MRPVRPLLVAAVVCGLPSVTLAQRDVTLTYLNLKVRSASQTNGFAVDQVNQVWVATNGGLPALQGGALAPFFPLNENSDGLLADNVQAVAFGPLQVGTTGDEHFFLGFGAGAHGIQHGRILANTGLSPRPPDKLLRQTAGGPEDTVFALASDGVRSLWAGTAGGLVEWEIGAALSPPRQVARVFRGGESVRALAVAPWGSDPAVLFLTPDRLYVVRRGDSTATRVGSVAFGAGTRLAFESRVPPPETDAGLWVASGQDLRRYVGGDLRGNKPGDASATSVRVDWNINDVAVDPLSGAVWIATPKGAYFQEPEGSPPALVAADCTNSAVPCRGWRRLGVEEEVHRVFLDRYGNPWRSTKDGLRVRLLRLLTLSGRRFVGDSARATIILEDASLAGNGVRDEPPIQVVKLPEGETVLKLTAAEDAADGGRFTAAFGFSPTAGGPGVLKVAPDDRFQVVYRFTVNGLPLDITGPEFSWSNEKPFEDDLWIGGGCFLKALGR